MEEEFVFTIFYNNQEIELNAKLQLFGYTHKITVMVNDIPILFEPDEERNYRAVLPSGEVNEKQTDTVLLQAIASKLEELFK
jgi:hypothetical protein